MIGRYLYIPVTLLGLDTPYQRRAVPVNNALRELLTDRCFPSLRWHGCVEDSSPVRVADA